MGRGAGLEVTGNDQAGDMGLLGHALCDPPPHAGGSRPGRRGPVHEYPPPRPRDLRRGRDKVSACWHRWHTCFFDLSGDQGLLGQVEGRTADDAAYWLAQAAPAWRDAIQVMAIDMCSIDAPAVRRMLPGARLVVNLFHTPCERDVRGRFASICDWCAQDDDLPELLTLARTVSRWEDEITCAVLTGVSNASSEGLNRIVKLEARQAYSFRNLASQRRRVRMACTRGSRRAQERRLGAHAWRPAGNTIATNFEEPVDVAQISTCR